VIISIIIHIIKFVNLLRLLLIWPFGKSCFAFTALIISGAKAALIILLIALNKKISR
jgi:hypothetical protein